MGRQCKDFIKQKEFELVFYIQKNTNIPDFTEAVHQAKKYYKTNLKINYMINSPICKVNLFVL